MEAEQRSSQPCAKPGQNLNPGRASQWGMDNGPNDVWSSGEYVCTNFKKSSACVRGCDPVSCCKPAAREKGTPPKRGKDIAD